MADMLERDPEGLSSDSHKRARRCSSALFIVSECAMAAVLAVIWSSCTLDSVEPPATSAPSSRRRLDGAIRSLPWGNLTFNPPPDVMPYGTTSRVSLLVSPELPMARLQELALQLQDNNGDAIDSRAQVSEYMRAELHASGGLVVKPLSARDQGVPGRSITTWMWEIAVRDDFEAEGNGDEYVGATLYALLNSGTDQAVPLRSWHHDVAVKITPYQRARRFVADNYQWLWTAFLVPAIPAVWQWSKRKPLSPRRGRLKLRRPNQ